MRNRRPMSETRKAVMSAQAKQRWENLPPEVREERIRRVRERHSEQFPHADELRARIREEIESGLLERQPCDQGCGELGEPLVSLKRSQLVGWRCFGCRRGACAHGVKLSTPDCESCTTLNRLARGE